MTILVVYQFEDLSGVRAAAFRSALLKLPMYKGWLSDDDDGECHELPNTVIVSLATNENDAQRDFEAQLDKMELRENLYSVLYTRLSTGRLFFSASAVGDVECDWETNA